MTRPHDGTAAEDPSIVPGFGPDVPLPRTAGGGLDPALDPDRYNPALDAAPLVGPLDPALDPDRYDPRRDTGLGSDLDAVPDLGWDPASPGSRRNPDGRTLPEMLGAGAFEEPRDTWAWAMGLVGVLLFLALASWIFGSIVRY